MARSKEKVLATSRELVRGLAVTGIIPIVVVAIIGVTVTEPA